MSAGPLENTMAIVSDPAAGRRSALSSAVRFVVAQIVYAAILFTAAGTLRWPFAWVYLGIMCVVVAIYVFVVLRLHPELVEERGKPPSDAKRWDRPLVAVVGVIGPIAFILLAGLDHRYGWTSPLPAAVHVAGLALAAAGGMVANRAVAANRFFSAVIRIQRDRGHHVVDSGPYRIVRHPGYLGSIVASLGGALALGSLYALALQSALVAVLVVRTALEDRTLGRELDGYREYAQRVRWRLVPFVW
jgi:protein-S-isoprenylcysteine O-methyltransferase Ste14